MRVGLVSSGLIYHIRPLTMILISVVVYTKMGWCGISVVCLIKKASLEARKLGVTVVKRDYCEY